MDEEREFSILDFDLGVWHAGLEVKDGVGIEPEGFEDSVDLCILELC